MAYKTARGITVEYPYALAAKAAKLGNDQMNELINDTVRIFHELQYADNEVVTLREEVRRLTAENNFMVRIMENRDA
jgi:hypothetical protein